MNNILQEMLKKYSCVSKEDYINAFKEIVQDVALYSLSLTDFFDNAAFYGGTALRIFYNLDRFSEDLDFSLCVKDESFSLEKYFQSISKTFEIFGLNFIPKIKEKNRNSNIQSAFLKGNTLEHILLIKPTTNVHQYIQKDETIKIKFEVDTNPPSEATYEYKYQTLPLPCKVKLYDESSLFAGKVHAVLCRNWRHRIKGRDLYDFEFYIKNNCLLNLKHLEQRMIQTGHIKEKETLTIEKVKTLLKSKFNEIDFQKAKTDVAPFVTMVSKLNVWSQDYFNYLADQLCDNIVKIFSRNYDISKFGESNILDEKLVAEIYFSCRFKKDNAYKETYERFSNYIVHEEELYFDGKMSKKELFFVIEGFKEKIYLKKNVNINKIISKLKE